MVVSLNRSQTITLNSRFCFWLPNLRPNAYRSQNAHTTACNFPGESPIYIYLTYYNAYHRGFPSKDPQFLETRKTFSPINTEPSHCGRCLRLALLKVGGRRVEVCQAMLVEGYKVRVRRKYIPIKPRTILPYSLLTRNPRPYVYGDCHGKLSDQFRCLT